MQKIVTLCFILIAPLLLQAQQSNFYPKQGEHYRLLENPLSDQQGTQLFLWYGCKSCFLLTQRLDEQHPQWQKVPVSIYKTWRPQTKIFFTLRSLGLPFSSDLQLMEAIHNGEIAANDLFSQKNFLLASGIKEEEFDRHFYSEAVNKQASHSDTIKRQAGLLKVPSALIDGRYYVDLSMSNNLQQFTQTIIYLEQLVDKNASSTKVEEDQH